ncbi:MAG: antitermination protein NusB, partial [Riemerella sp.]|nr:antitermination protein NusB [Riemerella sp.]
SLMDKIILATAISELDYFPLTPARIIMNEYIEIAKAFATDKSQIFVNGILDRYIKSNDRN